MLLLAKTYHLKFGILTIMQTKVFAIYSKLVFDNCRTLLLSFIRNPPSTIKMDTIQLLYCIDPSVK